GGVGVDCRQRDVRRLVLAVQVTGGGYVREQFERRPGVAANRDRQAPALGAVQRDRGRRRLQRARGPLGRQRGGRGRGCGAGRRARGRGRLNSRVDDVAVGDQLADGWFDERRLSG